MSEAAIVQRQPRGEGEVCTYCGRLCERTTSFGQLAATKDHSHPKSRGGNRTVWSCRQCNQIKGGMTAEGWTRFMVANPEWWSKPQFAKFGFRSIRGKAKVRRERRAFFKARAKAEEAKRALLADADATTAAQVLAWMTMDEGVADDAPGAAE